MLIWHAGSSLSCWKTSCESSAPSAPRSRTIRCLPNQFDALIVMTALHDSLVIRQVGCIAVILAQSCSTAAVVMPQLTVPQTVTLSQLDSLRRELIAITRNGFGHIAYGKVHPNALQLVFVASALGLETCRCRFTAAFGDVTLPSRQTNDHSLRQPR